MYKRLASIGKKAHTVVRCVVSPNRYSPEAYIRYLRKCGVAIGEGSMIWDPQNTFIDTTRPHMLRIGKFAKITSGVKVLAHDYSCSVCTQKYGLHVGEAKATTIGDNVFIGMNTVILMGADIGDNCIVGAGSVVSGSFPDDSVIGGNPARVICTLRELFDRRRTSELEAAVTYARSFRVKYGRPPTTEDMSNAFSWLYLPRTESSIREHPVLFKLNGVDMEKYKQAFLDSSPQFESFDAFLDYAFSWRED